MKPIALDVMGGDQMPQAGVEGAIAAARLGIPLILVGDEAVIQRELSSRGAELPVQHASDVISMDDHAGDVRRRKDSSIMVAMRLVKEDKASAGVSMGHSGATMAAALFNLGRIKGVDRPAILANIPSKRGMIGLLDAGANADCKPVYLQQFAIMGSVFAKAMWQVKQPTIGLISIGEEEHKGNELTLAAHALLKETAGITFYGNVEGRDLLQGTTNIVVADGFTGNIMLKQAEGDARVILGWVKDALTSSWYAKLGALLARSGLRAIADKLDPSEYGAQPLLGVNGYAFIGHGSADARAVTSALKTAKKALDAELVLKLEQGISRALLTEV